MDAYNKDAKDANINSSMDEAMAIWIIAMQTMVAEDMAKEIMVEVGDIYSQEQQ